MICTIFVLTELFNCTSGSGESENPMNMKYRSPALTLRYDYPFEEEFRQFRQKNPKLKGGELHAAFRKKYAELVKSALLKNN